jgi:histidinol-phosphate phosphatase family protein
MRFPSMSSTHSSPPSSSEPFADAAVRRLVSKRAGRQWCLFLDRDGVINKQIVGDYVRNWGDFEWLPSARRAFKVLRDWAPCIVVVTNQQGVGKGLMGLDELEDIHQNLRAGLAADGVAIDAIRACPHLESARCVCRKPRPGLVLGWLEEHPDIDRSLSIVVGDSESDVELARQVAKVTGDCAIVRIGRNINHKQVADATFDSLWSFANAIAKCQSAPP